MKSRQCTASTAPTGKRLELAFHKEPNRGTHRTYGRCCSFTSPIRAPSIFPATTVARSRDFTASATRKCNNPRVCTVSARRPLPHDCRSRLDVSHLQTRARTTSTRTSNTSTLRSSKPIFKIQKKPTSRWCSSWKEATRPFFT